MHFDFLRLGRVGGCGVGAKKPQNVTFSCLRVTCVWPWINWKSSLLCTGRTGPLLKMMTKSPFKFCLSFLRTTHCYQTYLCLTSFIMKNNGCDFGHGAWTPVFFSLSLLPSSCHCLQSREILVNLCCINQTVCIDVKNYVWGKTYTKRCHRVKAS